MSLSEKNLRTWFAANGWREAEEQLAVALAFARAEGYAQAKEQAAHLAETQRHMVVINETFPTYKAACEDVATRIRAMHLETK